VKHQEQKRHFSRDAVGEGRQIEFKEKKGQERSELVMGQFQKYRLSNLLLVC
jgi:hypothetical protein